MKTLIKNKIKFYRQEKGWTQEELAQKVGISRQAVISIEKYKYTPSLDLAFTLAKVFQLPITELFQQEEKE